MFKINNYTMSKKSFKMTYSNLIKKTIGSTFLVAVALLMMSTVLVHDDPVALIKKMEKAMGSWDKMYNLNDVQFTYNYEYPGQNKKDVSVEKYIFEGEQSWAKYTTHQINVMPEAGGEVVQSYVNNKITVTHDGKVITDEKANGLGVFLRKANYYWFTMMYKLNDPGVELSMMGTETMNGMEYHKVKVDFNPTKVGKEVNDAYIVYLNPKTDLVDQFYFSLPAMGVNQPVILMKVEYETINGVKVPAKRSVYQPDANGKYGDSPNLVQTSVGIKFNNGFTPADFMVK